MVVCDASPNQAQAAVSDGNPNGSAALRRTGAATEGQKSIRHKPPCNKPPLGIGIEPRERRTSETDVHKQGKHFCLIGMLALAVF